MSKRIKYTGPPAEAPALGLALEAGKFYEVPDEVATIWIADGVAEVSPAKTGRVAGPSPAKE